MTLFSHMKRQVKSQYDNSVKISNSPEKDDELKKIHARNVHTSSCYGKEK